MAIRRSAISATIPICSVNWRRSFGNTRKQVLGERHYVHNDTEADRYGVPSGLFTSWEPFEENSDLLFYEGLHGAVRSESVNIAQYADLKIGVVPVINLEWIQKIHRDRVYRGYSTEAITDVILRRMQPMCIAFVPNSLRRISISNVFRWSTRQIHSSRDGFPPPMNHWLLFVSGTRVALIFRTWYQ